MVPAAAVLAIALSEACLPSVSFSDDDHDTGCSEPAPPATGTCPPSWQCIDGEWMDTAGACPDPCPSSSPAPGSSCNVIGQTCSYEEWVDEPCGDEGMDWVDYTCTGDGWARMINYCQPEPECPDEMPIDGSDCSGWYDAYACRYQVDTACGTKMAWGHCDGVIWHFELDESCPTCGELQDSAACEADPACRWLEPGCGEPALSQAGCFPLEDCTDACGEGQTCTTVWTNPCWNSLCDACGAETNVCL
jgi:hypothetical protein